jgi:hypothetical protein
MIIGAVVFFGVQSGFFSTENIRAVGKDIWENSGKWLGGRR